ncbi:hypothetical protein ALP83_04568 [Pseudomonas syringae pv. actinidiae]|uniref:Uncharacterized protein n=1 Tax=Pseudomonas syringae pv. actinidiae TaxID=103796 RepID=A0A7Z6U8Y0_PSESF|nr:hypothetical protein ALQ15_104979 [Pseudomonas syringae pv. actinidiae]RMR52505.1 hypothetical protein ALP83_04568 [Pseudomonas syringae pv. actinidiae]
MITHLTLAIASTRFFDGSSYLVNLINTDTHAVIPGFYIYSADVQVSLQVIMSAGRNAELLAARASTVRFGEWRAVRFIEGHEPFSDDIYLYSVVSQQGVVQAESCKVVILGHEKKAASRKNLPLQSIAVEFASQYLTAAALPPLRIAKRLWRIDTQVSSHYFMQLHRIHPPTPHLACGDLRLAHNCTEVYLLALTSHAVNLNVPIGTLMGLG